MSWLRISIFALISIVNCACAANVNEELVTAMYAEDYNTFSNAYKQIDNKNNILINEGFLQGETLSYLVWSMYIHDSRFFDLVIQYSDPNTTDIGDNTAISITPSLCDLKKAKKLITKGADVNYQSKITGLTPLHSVSVSQCYDLAKLFLKHGANKQAKTKKDKLTPYDMAVKAGDPIMIKLLKFN